MNPFWNRRNVVLAVATTLISLAPLLRAQENPQVNNGTEGDKIETPVPVPVPAPVPQPTTLATQIQDAAGGVRAQSRDLVAACAKATAFGTTRSGDRQLVSPCSPNRTYTAPVRYQITRDEQGIKIHAPIAFYFGGDAGAKISAARRREMLEGARACESTIQKYWERYAVRIDLPMGEYAAGGPDKEAKITLIDAAGRSDALHYYYQGLNNDFALPSGQVLVHGGPYVACVDQCKRVLGFFASEVSRKELDMSCPLTCELPRAKEFCNMMVHEVGHRLGLPDEYDLGGCTLDRFVSQESGPWSTMAVPQIGILDGGLFGVDTQSTEFFPRHMQTVLEPLCPSSAP